jgi:hypothetical protein
MGWLGWVLLSYGVAVLGQTAILRWRVLGNSMVAFLVCAIPVGSAIVGALFNLCPLTPALSGTLLYGFLCEVWMFAFSSTFSSVSASLMLHLRAGAMRRDEIDQLYDNASMIRRRIGWLQAIGAAEETNSRLEPTRRGRRMASAFNAVRGFFGHA